MNTFWQVQEITEKPGVTLALLVPVEWYKTNPEWLAHSDEVGWDGDEFIDAEPGEEGADLVEGGGAITLDITDGPDLHPLDNVRIDMTVVVSVDA